ncbi:MAG TPA: type II toxin-antitoxin system prevent-host-death family antitoxin [Acidobacteriaceae bacterium]|nr:type II toxin-antitoxin system prevent-host-death family antitoxin [Acidobacteriaceae bacterium]
MAETIHGLMGEMKVVAAGKFKAQCLGLLDEVEAKRTGVVVTKNGRPVARVVPMPLVAEDPIFGFYKGKLEITGDIVSPLYSDDELEEFFERSAAQLK